MAEIGPFESRDRILLRLTALWGLTEAGLGGVVHALKLPFTGIVVGGTAIILITLIASFSGRKSSAILRAMMVVLIIKASVSPHTPIPAYFAVTFQGCLGALFFRCLPGIRLPAMLLGMLALLEGVIQKFVVITLIYGKSVWEAIDVVGQKLSVQWGLNSGLENASLWLIGIFTVYYLVGGVMVGWLAGRIPSRVEKMLGQYRETKPEFKIPEGTIRLPEKAGRKWPLRRLLPGLLILLMIILVFGGMPAEEGSARAKCIYVLVRSGLVLAGWFFLVGPLIRKLIARLQKRETMIYGQEIARAMSLMPRIRQMAALAWAQTAFENKFVRGYRFLLRLIVYSIVCDD